MKMNFTYYIEPFFRLMILFGIIGLTIIAIVFACMDHTHIVCKNIEPTNFVFNGIYNVVSNYNYYECYCEAITSNNDVCQYKFDSYDGASTALNECTNNCIKNITYTDGFFCKNTCYDHNPNVVVSYHNFITGVIVCCSLIGGGTIFLSLMELYYNNVYKQNTNNVKLSDDTYDVNL